MSDVFGVGGVPGVPPAQALQLALVGSAPQVLVNGCGLLVGWAVEETTGLAAARLLLGDGNAVGSQNALAPLPLSAGQGRVDSLAGHGIIFERALIAVATAGAVGGSIWVVMLTRVQLDNLVLFTAAGNG